MASSSACDNNGIAKSEPNKTDVSQQFLQICGPKIAKYLSEKDKSELEIATKFAHQQGNVLKPPNNETKIKKKSWIARKS